MKETPEEEFELARVDIDLAELEAMDAAEPEQLVKLGMVTEGAGGSRTHHFIPRNCSHQKDCPLPCAWPSCPQGHPARVLILVIIRASGEKVRARFKRRFNAQKEVFQWTQDTAS